MTWKQARMIAAQHCARLHLPRRLDGVTVLLTVYDDENTLRFLKTEEPEITLPSQRLINSAFAREVRKRGATVHFVTVNINDYFGWLGKFDLKDNAGMRAQFVSWLTCAAPKFLPKQT